MSVGSIFIGLSGYDYPPWRGSFYPASLPRTRWLGYVARRFPTIEINGTFYSLKSPAIYARWIEETRDSDVTFALKGSGFITHRLRLREPQGALANFYASGVLALGTRTGPFLWQLPPRMTFDEARLSDFLRLLPRDSAEAEGLARQHDERLKGEALTQAAAHVRFRHALEVRDESFCQPPVYAMLRSFGIALVVADTGGRYPAPRETTADFMYVRLHGPRELYASGYTVPELQAWAARIESWARRGSDVYVYFDNNIHGHAPRDAETLRICVEQALVREAV